VTSLWARGERVELSLKDFCPMHIWFTPSLSVLVFPNSAKTEQQINNFSAAARFDDEMHLRLGSTCW
jgi:hypothetical protein